MRKIIVFGNVPLATWLVKQIKRSKNVQLIGVVCDEYDENYFANHGMEEVSLYAFCKTEGIPVLSFEKALEKAKNIPILGISVRYNKIFKESYFEAFTPGIINLHGGELPRYRGANIANYAILEKASKGAGTLHFIAKGLDEGDIVEREFFLTDRNETAYSFFIKTISALQVAFLRFLERLENNGPSGDVKRKPQTFFINEGEIGKTYFKKGIEKHREIDFDKQIDWDVLDLKARAFYFPGHQGAILKTAQAKYEIKPFVNDNNS